MPKAPILALPPGKPVLLLPQKAPSTAMTSQPANATVTPCKKAPAIDPLVLEHLTVWDAEESGNRHWDEKTQTLHIVQTEAVDRVRITYTGPDIPPKLEVRRNGEVLPALPGGGNWTAEVTYAAALDPYGDSLLGPNPFPRLFTALSPVCTYTFTAPQFTVTVKVYNPDQWKLKVKVPAAKSQALGGTRAFGADETEFRRTETERSFKDGQFVKTTNTATATVSDNGKRASTTSSKETLRIAADGVTTTRKEMERAYQARSSKLVDIGWVNGEYKNTTKGKGKPKTDSDRGPRTRDSAGLLSALPGAAELVTLECNGTAVQIEALSAISGVLQIGKAIRGLFKALRNAVPKVGWVWDVDIKFCEGDITLLWGWRETKGSAVTYGVGLEANYTLIEATGSFGVGVSVGAAAELMQATAKLVGVVSGSVAIKAGPLEFIRSAEDGKPDPAPVLTATGEVKIGVSVEVSAGTSLTVKGGGTTVLLSVEAVLKYGPDGVVTETTGKAGGLELSYEAKLFGITVKNDKTRIMDAVTLGKITFPGPGDPGSGEFVTRDQVKDRAEFVLSEGWFPLRFYETVQTVEYRKEWIIAGDVKKTRVTAKEPVPVGTVADLIADKIWARKDRLDLDVKVIEGIIYALRDKLGANDWSVSLDRVKKVLDSAAFAVLLTRAECPVKSLIIDHGLK